MNINESPVFLLLDDNISVKHKNLPVNLYESSEGLITECRNLLKLLFFLLRAQMTGRLEV